MILKPLVPKRLNLWTAPLFCSNSNKTILNKITTTNFSSFSSTATTTNLSFTPLFDLLKQCKSLSQVKSIHKQILVIGGNHQAQEEKIARLIISTYIDHNAPLYALALLQRLSPSPSAVYWWNSLIRRYVRLGFLHQTFHVHLLMLRLEWKPDHFTYPFVLKACGELPCLSLGRGLHGVIVVNGFDSNVFVCNGLVAMYARCGAVQDGVQVFDEMLKRGINDLVSWNSVVSAYVQNGDWVRALNMFGEMKKSENVSCLPPDAVSLVNVLRACASIGVGAVMQGKQMHGYAVGSGLFAGDVYVGNAIVDMYAKCRMMGEAKKVFELMEEKDVVSWNTMVTGYSQSGSVDDAMLLLEEMREKKVELNVVTWSAVIAAYAQRGHGVEALNVFRQMQLSGLAPNVVTLVSLLSGCAAVEALLPGKETHAYAIRCILRRACGDHGEDVMVHNALIDMYAKCKSPTSAHTIFNSISPSKRNVVTWTVMIGGYAQHGDANEALQLFSQMLRGTTTTNVVPNAFTISCSLMACARLAALRSGRQIHAYVIRHRYESAMLFVANCLIDMYSKCGDVDAAEHVFGNMKKRNDVSWTSLMTGYGMQGLGDEALQLFGGMQEAGHVPDGVTFIVVLYACSHSGMVDHGIKYFSSMQREYGVVPGVEHYACMVDILGRSGRLDKAMELVNSMPMKPNAAVWVALLSACRTHANVELGEYAAEKLSEIESVNDGSYTLLSNIYANAGRWKDVARVRSQMRQVGIRKRPGWSSFQGKKGTSSFYAGDRSHPMSQQIYEVLADLIQRIKILGYVPETSFALHDVDDEEKGDLLTEHSEKLALAYAILTSPTGSAIRITKNLRVCGDCHKAFTFISKIVDHEIIVRDSSRFHRFKNGSCSCRGYW